MGGGNSQKFIVYSTSLFQVKEDSCLLDFLKQNQHFHSYFFPFVVNLPSCRGLAYQITFQQLVSGHPLRKAFVSISRDWHLSFLVPSWFFAFNVSLNVYPRKYTADLFVVVETAKPIAHIFFHVISGKVMACKYVINVPRRLSNSDQREQKSVKFQLMMALRTKLELKSPVFKLNFQLYLLLFEKEIN